jgi:hypothetical protein
MTAKAQKKALKPTVTPAIGGSADAIKSCFAQCTREMRPKDKQAAERCARYCVQGTYASFRESSGSNSTAPKRQ